MLSKTRRQEIDYRTIKLIVGLIAIFLASITSFFAEPKITSISAAYYSTGWAEVFFVGSLFAIASFLAAYNGRSTQEMVLSKFASFFAIYIALFPCGCDGHEEIIKHVHGLSAGLLFAILAYFCIAFQKRAKVKNHVEAKRRATIYFFCSILIIVAICVMATDSLTRGSISHIFSRLTFYGESTGLWAFGVSWLTASKVLPCFADDSERLHLI